MAIFFVVCMVLSTILWVLVAHLVRKDMKRDLANMRRVKSLRKRHWTITLVLCLVAVVTFGLAIVFRVVFR